MWMQKRKEWNREENIEMNWRIDEMNTADRRDEDKNILMTTTTTTTSDNVAQAERRWEWKRAKVKLSENFKSSSVCCSLSVLDFNVSNVFLFFHFSLFLPPCGLLDRGRGRAHNSKNHILFGSGSCRRSFFVAFYVFAGDFLFCIFRCCVMAWPESATSEREMWAEAEVAKKKDDTEVEYVSKWREQSKKTKKTRLKTRRKWVHNERLLFFQRRRRWWRDRQNADRIHNFFSFTHRSEYICCFSLSSLAQKSTTQAIFTLPLCTCMSSSSVRFFFSSSSCSAVFVFVKNSCIYLHMKYSWFTVGTAAEYFSSRTCENLMNLEGTIHTYWHAQKSPWESIGNRQKKVYVQTLCTAIDHHGKREHNVHTQWALRVKICCATQLLWYFCHSSISHTGGRHNIAQERGFCERMKEVLVGERNMR